MDLDSSGRWGIAFIHEKMKYKNPNSDGLSIVNCQLSIVNIRDLYNKIGKDIGINPLLLQAIAMSLSNERQDAFVCHRGVCQYGLMLLSMPGAKLVGFMGHPEDLMAVEVNISHAAMYLRYLLQQYEYDLKKALVAYLCGRYDSRYIHDAEKILWAWRNLLWQDTPKAKEI